MTAPFFLQVVFLAMILLKGFSYSLNNPCKEILYQPTNSAVKFKCKVRGGGVMWTWRPSLPINNMSI